jgi:hypothetical protein
MDFLFHFQLLIGVIAQSHSADNKKADFWHFLNSSKLSAKSIQVISPYTGNALDSHTVLHTLWLKHYR